MHNAVAIFVPLGAFLTTAFVIYIFFRARKQERIALIESGRDANIFVGNHKARLMGQLKSGMVLVGVGLGFLLGEVLTNLDLVSPPFSFLTAVPICAGLALIFFYIVKKDDIID